MKDLSIRCALVLLVSVAAAAQSPESALKINQIQVIGTHNSYHAGIAPNEAKVWQAKYAEAYKGLDYSHPALPVQFDAGVRQIELDVYADTKGGLYAHPKGPEMAAAAGLPADPPFDPNHVMDKPGFKVMHVQDLDYRSTCQPFTACLQQVLAWSNEHPKHIPIFILVETKQGSPKGIKVTETEPFTPTVFDALDAEIRSVFPPQMLITPDDVRGSYATLNDAALAGNWPTLANARGKVIFLMDQRPVEATYLEGHPTLKGRVIFTNAPPGAPDAAFTEMNDGPDDAITALVKQGYLVRTRTDADTKEARTDSTARRDAAIASGAQILSTDYPANEPAKWEGHYSVSLPNTFARDKSARCDPVDAACGGTTK